MIERHTKSKTKIKTPLKMRGTVYFVACFYINILCVNNKINATCTHTHTHTHTHLTNNIGDLPRSLTKVENLLLLEVKSLFLTGL